MERSKYAIFMQVVEKGSFSAAAEELGYTPSGLNRMISSLEDELGVPLFYRTKKGVFLTENGEELLPTIRQVVYWDEQLREQSDEIRGVQRGNLNIGTIYSIASMWMPDIVRKFQNQYPGISVSVLQGSHQELNDWMEEGKLDLNFTSKRGPMANWISLYKDPIVVWVNKKHPLAAQPVFPQESLEQEPYIMTLPGGDTDAEYLMNSRRIKPNVRYTSRDNFTTYRMVEAGLGISLNNQLMSRRWSGDVVALPLFPADYVELGVCFPQKRQCSPAAKKFLNCIKEIDILHWDTK